MPYSCTAHGVYSSQTSKQLTWSANRSPSKVFNHSGSLNVVSKPLTSSKSNFRSLNTSFSTPMGTQNMGWDSAEDKLLAQGLAQHALPAPRIHLHSLRFPTPNVHRTDTNQMASIDSLNNPGYCSTQRTLRSTECKALVTKPGMGALVD